MVEKTLRGGVETALAMGGSLDSVDRVVGTIKEMFGVCNMLVPYEYFSLFSYVAREVELAIDKNPGVFDYVLGESVELDVVDKYGWVVRFLDCVNSNVLRSEENGGLDDRTLLVHYYSCLRDVEAVSRSSVVMNRDMLVGEALAYELEVFKRFGYGALCEIEGRVELDFESTAIRSIVPCAPNYGFINELLGNNEVRDP